MSKIYDINKQEIILNPTIEKWKDKTIVFFGDSRTWYDEKEYNANTKEEWQGKICKGYQQFIKEKLNCSIINEGKNGDTSIQICSNIRNYNFSNVDAVFLEGGINDFIQSASITLGEINAIGSSFNTNTVYGAWQSAIEYILTNYPEILIFIDTPAIAWENNNEFPYSTAQIKKIIAELYNIPCLDLYKHSGINIINRDYFYCDDIAKTGWRLHFNDQGNQQIGNIITNYILNYS